VSAHDSLFDALGRLDRRLERAEVIAKQLFGMEDAFRGLHISRDEVERLLAQPPGTSLFYAPAAQSGGDRLSGLAERYALTGFEIDVILLALAPEIDLRYQRLYAFLQDDVTRRKPTVDLALHLLCETAEQRLAARAHFFQDAPLLRNRLVVLGSEAESAEAPLLSRPITLDEQITHHLLGEIVLDRRLRHVARLFGLGEANGAPALEPPASRRVYIRCPVREERLIVSRALAQRLERPLLHVDLGAVGPNELDIVIAIALRQAELDGQVPFFDRVSGLEAPSWRATESLATAPQLVLLGGAEEWRAQTLGLSDVTELNVAAPDRRERTRLWTEALASMEPAPEADSVEAVAQRFALHRSQIAEAARSARASRRTSKSELFSLARGQYDRTLGSLATKIETCQGWNDLVVPEDTARQLREICVRVGLREDVMKGWGFERKLSTGRGTSVLCSGASGTGKTMAAGIIANELGLDLYKIDLASMVSKYIGETEKNLERVFSAADAANAILFFDEADALFGKRSESSDARDRYANMEVSHLLQKMDSHEGITILATNFKQNLDEAFLRRFAFIVHFPLPGADERRRIWERAWPDAVPREPDLRLELLAETFPLSGGSIRNIALAAAFLAMDSKGKLTRQHVLHALRRELAKLGRQLTQDEIELFEDT
jgi:hypothetical protein